MKNKKVMEKEWDEEKYYWEEAIKGCHWQKIDDVMSAKREAFRSWFKKYNNLQNKIDEYIPAQPNLKKNPIIDDLKGDNKALSERYYDKFRKDIIKKRILKKLLAILFIIPILPFIGFWRLLDKICDLIEWAVKTLEDGK